MAAAKPPADAAKLSKAEAKAEAKRLAKKIAEHDRLYYQEDAPVISDADYDALRLRLEAIEQRFPELASPESPTAKVGAAALEKFGKVRHRVPMLSLSNAFSNDEVVDFVARVRRFLKIGAEAALEITAEPKIDGLSISLRYDNGVLIEAATRGDGYEGENVTAEREDHYRRAAPAGGAQHSREHRYSRRNLYAAGGFPEAQRVAEAGRRKNLRQSAQCRGRIAAPARCENHRVASFAIFRLFMGRGEAAAGQTLNSTSARHSSDGGCRSTS